MEEPVNTQSRDGDKKVGAGAGEVMKEVREFDSAREAR